MLKTKPIRFNRIISMLLSLIMLCSALPFSASAEEDYGIAICGTMLTPSNYEEFLENYTFGQIAYDPSTNTLTFSGFMRSMVNNTPVVSYYGRDTVNVVLKGGNSFSGIFFESDEGSIAFSAESTGSLGFGKSNTGQTGIRCAYMDVDGGRISMTDFTNGIKADFIDVTGGSLAISAHTSHNITDRGISANEMRVSGGEVYVCGYSDGLNIGDRLIVSGGDVIVEDVTRAVSADDVGISGTGVLNVEGGAVGIEASEVSVTGSAELHAKITQSGKKLAIIAYSYLGFDKNTHFIKKPVSAKIAALPEGETVFDDNGDVATEVSIVPWIACFVSRNGGAEERVEWNFNNKEANLFQCPVGETVTVRLVSYDEYGTFDTTSNGDPPHAQVYVRETVSGKSEKSFTFSPEDRIESEVPTTEFGTPTGVPHQFSYYHNIFFRQLGSERKVGALVFETLKGDLTFDEITTQTVDINKMRTIPLPMNDSRGNPVVPSKDGAPKAEDLEVELTGDSIFATYIVQSLTEHNALYVLPGAIGTAEVTVSFKGNMSYNPAQITFSVVCQCNNCADGANDSALTRHIATDSTCTMEGNDEYWECSQCGKLFADADGKTQITDLQTVLTPAKGHSFTETVGDEYLKLAADCENPAVYYKSCEHCGISTKELYDLRAAAASFTPGSAETVTIDGVEFYILAVDDGKALILSKYAMLGEDGEGIPFGSKYAMPGENGGGDPFADAGGAKWAESSVRAWLNGEWLAGKPVLKNLAKETAHEVGYGFANIYLYHHETDSETRDKVFLLSEGDVFGSLANMPDEGNFDPKKYDYTYNNAKLTAPGGSWAATDADGNGCNWWLRTRNLNQPDGVYLDGAHIRIEADKKIYESEPDDEGWILYSGEIVPAPVGVRPAMWVRFDDPAPEWQTRIESITPGAADTVTIDDVEFHVLAKDAAKGRALLLTKHVLFNEDSDLVFGNTPSWADSRLMKFMNGIIAQTANNSRFFYPDNAPTLAQYAQETEIYTPAGYDSTEFVTTRDTFFLLSEADVFGTQNDEPAEAEAFTYNGAPLPAPGGSWIATDLKGTPRYWWLRSPRNNQYSVAQILDDGTLNSINPDVEDFSGIRGIRPALWIQYREPVPEPETFENGSALGHDWGTASYSWSTDPVSGNRTCTAQHTCTREGCNKGEFERVTATREETIAPTCTEKGEYTYTATFTKAGFTTQYQYEDIAKLEHIWGETVDAKYLKTAADCTNAAVYYKSCGRCGDKHTSETFIHGEPLGHDFDEWYVEKEPTDREKGLEKRLCKNCDHFETKELDMIKYTVDPADPENGGIEINPADPKSGDEVIITPKPDEGYEVDEVKVTDKDGKEIGVKKNDDGNYSFEMPESDVNIIVTYKEVKNDTSVDPQTGDDSNIALWFVLMCLAFSGVVYTIKKQRKCVKGR